MVNFSTGKKPLRRMLFGLSVTLASVTPAISQTQEGTPTDQQERYEVWYLENMIDHHATAIALANLSGNRTVNPSVLQASANIASTESAELSTMQNWLYSWYGIDYQPNAVGNLGYVAQFTGPDYDAAFLAALGQIQSAEVTESQRASQYAWHPDLASAANTVALNEGQQLYTIANWSVAGQNVNVVNAYRGITIY